MGGPKVFGIISENYGMQASLRFPDPLAFVAVGESEYVYLVLHVFNM